MFMDYSFLTVRITRSPETILSWFLSDVYQSARHWNTDTKTTHEKPTEEWAENRIQL